MFKIFLTFMLKLSIHLLIPFHNLHSSFIVLFSTHIFHSHFTLSFSQKYMRLWGICVVWGFPPPTPPWGKATSFPCGHYYALTQMQFAACDAKKGELRIQRLCKCSLLTHSLFSAVTLFLRSYFSNSLPLSLLYFYLSLFESHFT